MRFDSWYDDRLVVTKGEQILAELDDYGVKTLRAAKLIWSGWRESGTLVGEGAMFGGYTGRFVEIDDPARFRMFFLSLLWRAAATKRDEFAKVNLPDDDLEILRESIVQKRLPADSFYPVTLVQFSTLWDPHNQTPIVLTVPPPPGHAGSMQPYDVFRFYFDGLVPYFHCPGAGAATPQDLGPTAVGAGKILAVGTTKFDQSWQHSNISQIIRDAEASWPGFGAR